MAEAITIKDRGDRQRLLADHAVLVCGLDGDGHPTPLLGAGSIGTGDASAVNQSVVQANAGSNASKAESIQGIDNGKPVGVTSARKQLSGVPSSFTPATADGTLFTLAAGEIGFIQNLSADAPMAVKKGTGASTSSFNFILATGVAIDDGKGGAVQINDWVGAVSIAKIAGTARYIAWKQS